MLRSGGWVVGAPRRRCRQLQASQQRCRLRAGPSPSALAPIPTLSTPTFSAPKCLTQQAKCVVGYLLESTVAWGGRLAGAPPRCDSPRSNCVSRLLSCRGGRAIEEWLFRLRSPVQTVPALYRNVARKGRVVRPSPPILIGKQLAIQRCLASPLAALCWPAGTSAHIHREPKPRVNGKLYSEPLNRLRKERQGKPAALRQQIPIVLHPGSHAFTRYQPRQAWGCLFSNSLLSCTQPASTRYPPFWLAAGHCIGCSASRLNSALPPQLRHACSTYKRSTQGTL